MEKRLRAAIESGQCGTQRMRTEGRPKSTRDRRKENQTCGSSEESEKTFKTTRNRGAIREMEDKEHAQVAPVDERKVGVVLGVHEVAEEGEQLAARELPLVHDHGAAQRAHKERELAPLRRKGGGRHMLGEVVRLLGPLRAAWWERA